MTEHDFDVRLAHIEEKLEMNNQELTKLNAAHKSAMDQIYEAIKNTAIALNTAKSAHHRIDDFKSSICWTLGFSVTVVGVFASVLTAFLSKGS